MSNVPAAGPLLRVATLGCRVNQYETELARQALVDAGYHEAAPGQSADLCLLNTCTVTAEGDAKGRQLIRQLAARNPGSKLVVMGCYATRAPVEIAALPGVTEVLADKRELPDLLMRLGAGQMPTGLRDFSRRQRAYVKVQDGCLLRCSYCVIPLVRPEMSSRPADEILAEVRRLVASGHGEVVLTGIHLGHYGVDQNAGRPKSSWVRLSHLVERLANLPGDFRVRLSSIEGTEVTRELLAVMARYPERVCPHLHVALQSGSDGVLRRMKRRWGAKRLVDRCRLVKETLDHPALTTDVIVGFPGETDEEFAETCQVVEEIGFSKLHVFPFSARPETPAAHMVNQVAPQVRARRIAELTALGDRLQARYYRSLLGRSLRVLVEGEVPDRPGWVQGTACRFAPVQLPGAATLKRRLVEVVATELCNGVLRTPDVPQNSREKVLSKISARPANTLAVELADTKTCP